MMSAKPPSNLKFRRSNVPNVISSYSLALVRSNASGGKVGKGKAKTALNSSPCYIAILLLISSYL